jgi:hypothetical protein
MFGTFDRHSAIRERLYLLSQLGTAEQYANWAYSPRLDAWQHVSGRTIPVRTEGSASLDRIATVHHLTRADAMAFIGYPEGEAK